MNRFSKTRSQVSLCREGSRKQLIAALVMVLAVGVSHVYSAVIVHAGNSDPTTEGWALTYAGQATGDISVSPIVDTGYGSTLAWQTLDNYAAGVSNLATYRYAMSPTAVSQSLSQGWSLSANMRVASTILPDAVDTSIYLAFDTGTTRYSLSFGADADGNALMKVGAGATIYNMGGGYHFYEMRYDPVGASVNVYVDGGFHSTYTGQALVTPAAVQFGAGSSAATGIANWNSVTFSSAPEPSRLCLLMGALALIICKRDRRTAWQVLS